MKTKTSHLQPISESQLFTKPELLSDIQKDQFFRNHNRLSDNEFFLKEFVSWEQPTIDVGDVEVSLDPIQIEIPCSENPAIADMYSP